MKRIGRGINGYFVHILISFMLLLLLPVSIMGGIWYRRAEEQDYQYKIEREKERINIVGLEIERRIETVEIDLASFRYSKAFRNYVLKNQPIYTIKEDIMGLVKKNEIMTALYLYDAGSQMIYSSASGLYAFEEYYDTEWIEHVQNTVQFQRLPVRNNLNQNLYNQIKGTGMERIYSPGVYLSILSQKTFDTYLLANIDVKALGEYIQKIYPMNSKRGEQSYLISSDGQIFYANEYAAIDLNLPVQMKDEGMSNLNFWEEKDRIFFAEKLVYPDMYYVESYLKENFFGSESGHKSYIMGVCLLLLLFLVGVAYIFSRRLYQPIEGLYDEIKKSTLLSEKSMTNDLKALQRAFVEMSYHYERAVKEEKSYQEFMRMSCLRMLLNGTFSQKRFFEENRQIYQQQEIVGYQLLVCDLSEIKYMEDDVYENFRFRLNAVINSYLQAVSKGVFTEVEETCFAAYYGISNRQNAEYFQNFLLKVVNQLSASDHYFAVSIVMQMEDEVRHAYRQCKARIKNAVFFEKEKGILLPDEKKKSKKVLTDISINYEKSLIKEIVLGNEDAIGAIIIELEKELKIDHDADFARDLCGHIMVTLDKEFYFYKLMGIDVQHECHQKDTLRSLLDFMGNILINMSERLHQDDLTENRYCYEAKEYLEQNYMRDINVTEVADYLGISYAYLSKIFKTQPEGNGKLSEYLNILRIEKSKTYLKNTGMTLGEIAEQVGYNNVQSFQRFFKKYENMTPGEYRKFIYASGKN